jgi:hypothetical protein
LPNGPQSRAQEISRIARTCPCFVARNRPVWDARPGGPGAGGQGMAAKRNAEQPCELCRTLGDIVRALDPDKYRYGPECEVGLAIRAALELHRERAHKTREGNGK